MPANPNDPAEARRLDDFPQSPSVAWAVTAAAFSIQATALLAWPAVRTFVAAGRPDQAAEVVKMAAGLEWSKFVAWRAEHGIDEAVGEAIEALFAFACDRVGADTKAE